MITVPRRRVPLVLALIVLCVCGVTAAVGTSAFVNTTSSQAVGCSGDPCLPGSGYTLDSVWDCSVISRGTNCIANGTTTPMYGVSHTWGWGSAAYNGAGSTSVLIENLGGDKGTGLGMYATGSNLARTCYLSNCNDQGSDSFLLLVQNTGSNAHTIYGHGKA